MGEVEYAEVPRFITAFALWQARRRVGRFMRGWPRSGHGVVVLSIPSVVKCIALSSVVKCIALSYAAPLGSSVPRLAVGFRHPPTVGKPSFGSQDCGLLSPLTRRRYE